MHLNTLKSNKTNFRSITPEIYIIFLIIYNDLYITLSHLLYISNKSK